jgi:hypothetical protein
MWGEQKSDPFALYNKKKKTRIKHVNSLLFIHPNIRKFKKVEILQKLCVCGPRALGPVKFDNNSILFK